MSNPNTLLIAGASCGIDPQRASLPAAGGPLVIGTARRTAPQDPERGLEMSPMAVHQPSSIEAAVDQALSRRGDQVGHSIEPRGRRRQAASTTTLPSNR